MNLKSDRSHICHENLLNEFKGNLFEYLFANGVARLNGIESEFIQSLGDSFSEQLQEYESCMRKDSPELVQQLSILANDLLNKSSSVLPLKNCKKVFLIGKVAGGSHDDRWKECDVLLIDSNDKQWPISIKLCKSNAFVNTKSGGVASFYSKYFRSFPVEPVKQCQQEFNQLINEKFLMMSYRLHEIADIPWEDGFENWKSEGLPLLPGELPQEMREVLFEYYHSIATHIQETFKILSARDPENFKRSLLPLCGHGQENIWQLTCFHGASESSNRHSFKKYKISTTDEMRKSLSQVEILEIKDGVSSFDLETQDFTLQIRVKPMNRFNTPSMKVNCSIKYR